MRMRTIGGSLLPSNDSRVLSPLGNMQVRVIEELDTHGLFLNSLKGETLLAMHPNGYSCRELAERIASGNTEKVLAQVEYILACGGLCRTQTEELI